jgi:hypothetical protein
MCALVWGRRSGPGKRSTTWSSLPTCSCSGMRVSGDLHPSVHGMVSVREQLHVDGLFLAGPAISRRVGRGSETDQAPLLELRSRRQPRLCGWRSWRAETPWRLSSRPSRAAAGQWAPQLASTGLGLNMRDHHAWCFGVMSCPEGSAAPYGRRLTGRLERLAVSPAAGEV